MPAEKKPIKIVQVSIFADSRLHVGTEGVTDQEDIRNILHVAEEAVISGALRKATESMSKIIPLPGPQISKLGN
jgi:hypothetical protein